MKTIDVIGCGKVGKTLARLWTEHGVLDVRSILNRSLQSASRAVRFVAAGRAVDSYTDMESTDLVMISAPDEAIESCCRELSLAGVLRRGAIVFHCSGSLPSDILEPARRQGASIASVHPVKSFADPSSAVATFAGTFCAVEGDPPACAVLSDVLHRCGATTFHVKQGSKTVYHAGTVVVCNYLVALLEAGLRCFENAGLDRETAIGVIRPIVAETVDNLFRLGPVRALTGPIARGEPSVVQSQSEALGQWDERIAAVYRSLGRVAVELALEQGHADPDALASIERTLRA